MIFDCVAVALSIVWVIVLCAIMPQYKAKDCLITIFLGAILVIAYYIFRSGWYVGLLYKRLPTNYLLYILPYISFSINIALCLLLSIYLFVSCLKVHSKLLNSINAIVGILCVLILIYRMMTQVFYTDDVMRRWYDFLDIYPIYFRYPYLMEIDPIRCAVFSITFTLRVVLLIILKYFSYYDELDRQLISNQPSKVCPNCSNPISDQNKYCTKCGTPLRK